MKRTVTSGQPWLHSAITDGVFILAPPFVALLLVVCFPATFQGATAVPVYYWLFLVVFIDVAHVYSTLYRTYFIKGSLKKDTFLIAVPVVCYLAGVILHSYSGMLFWRVLAYLAIFHFVRQQYGFMRLYSRQEVSGHWAKRIDTAAIYAATVYPLFYWHFDGERNFNWFIDNDMVTHRSPVLLTAGLVIYLLVMAIYLVKEAILILKTGSVNLPRNLLVLGTALSWYFGIVYFNGDLAFTTLNVISHGIPYMALVWVFEKKRSQKDPGKQYLIARYSFSRYGGVLIFVLFLALLAYLEEGLWDGMVWREHGTVFGTFAALPKIADERILALLVPLLALPQFTHYVLDGFIWKMGKQKSPADLPAKAA